MSEWKRSIVRVWHKPPMEGGEYQGTAFFVAPRYLLTAKHVIEKFDYKEIYLHGEGAWIGGGLRGISRADLHPDLDVAVLQLQKPVDEAPNIPLQQRELSFLRQGQLITLAGFTSGDRGLETPKLEVSAYDGRFNLEVIHTIIGQGMSGGPALLDEKLVGITRARDDSHTYVIPVDTFWDFIEPLIGTRIDLVVQPISLPEMENLRYLLRSVQISEADAFGYFRQFMPDSRVPDYDGNDFFRCCLSFLAQKEHASHDNAPLFQFLEYCHPEIKQQIAPNALAQLEVWKNEVAGRLGLNLQDLRSHMQTVRQSPVSHLVGVLVKIEPKDLVSDERFTVTAWTYYGGEFRSQEIIEPENSGAGFTRAELDHYLPTILNRSLRCLGGAAQNAIIEIIAPFVLYDWNINKLMMPVGPIAQPLGKLYSLAFRSWDRIYHRSYDSIRHQWSTRWLARPQRLHGANIHIILDHTVCGPTFYDQLTPDTYALVTLFTFPRISTTDLYRDIIGVALAAGLPFAFWPLQSCAEDLCPQISSKLAEHDVADWPDMLKQWRTAPDSYWYEVQMLWDNPEKLPPDIDYSLVIYD